MFSLGNQRQGAGIRPLRTVAFLLCPARFVFSHGAELVLENAISKIAAAEILLAGRIAELSPLQKLYSRCWWCWAGRLTIFQETSGLLQKSAAEIPANQKSCGQLAGSPGGTHRCWDAGGRFGPKVWRNSAIQNDSSPKGQRTPRASSLLPENKEHQLPVRTRRRTPSQPGTGISVHPRTLRSKLP